MHHSSLSLNRLITNRLTVYTLTLSSHRLCLFRYFSLFLSTDQLSNSQQRCLYQHDWSVILITILIKINIWLNNFNFLFNHFSRRWRKVSLSIFEPVASYCLQFFALIAYWTSPSIFPNFLTALNLSQLRVYYSIPTWQVIAPHTGQRYELASAETRLVDNGKGPEQVLQTFSATNFGFRGASRFFNSLRVYDRMNIYTNSNWLTWLFGFLLL